MKSAIKHEGQHPDCYICKNKIDFDMPTEILDAATRGKLVIFAGAGVSTENPIVFPWTLYQEVKDELEIPVDTKISFSKVMTLFEEKKGKKELIQMIKQRMDYVDAFPELYRNATRFHRELSTLFFIKEIVTTNWDDYFERECGAIPMVTDGDFVFWDLPDRKVFKLHGSVNNYGSIIATSNEYSKKYRQLRDGLIGANLKLSLGTKTLVFCGYSFQDEDFNKIYTYIVKTMGDIKPKIYLVSPNKKDEKALKKINGVGIDTDATYFLFKLKQHFVDSHFFISDERYEVIFSNLVKIQYEHAKIGTKKYNFKNNPETIYLASYQDGIIHAFERITKMKKTGEYSHAPHLSHLIDSYYRGRKIEIRNKNYHDVAYIDGYIVGLMCMLLGDEVEDNFPMYYLYGYRKEIFTENEYLKLRNKAKNLHKSAYEAAREWANQNVNSPDTVMHHPPFI